MGGCHSIGGLISNFLTVFGRQRVNFFIIFFLRFLVGKGLISNFLRFLVGKGLISLIFEVFWSAKG